MYLRCTVTYQISMFKCKFWRGHKIFMLILQSSYFLIKILDLHAKLKIFYLNKTDVFIKRMMYNNDNSYSRKQLSQCHVPFACSCTFCTIQNIGRWHSLYVLYFILFVLNRMESYWFFFCTNLLDTLARIVTSCTRFIHSFQIHNFNQHRKTK